MEKTDNNGIAFSVLLSLSLAHFMNDAFQSVLSAVYPVLKDNLLLRFSEIGLITLVYQVCASVFQPVFGFVFDKKASPWYLVVGSASTCAGLFFLAYADSLFAVLVSVVFVGFGSSIIHPEASRLTHRASGGRHGLAQSIFQVGGNLGSSLGPLLAALVITPYGQRYIVFFAVAAAAAIVMKYPIIVWHRGLLRRMRLGEVPKVAAGRRVISRRMVAVSLGILLILIFSKYVYMASITNFYTFYLIEKFGVTVQQSQYYLFAFLFAMAAGTFVGGPVGDRIGRKYVIWVSILGVAPFTLLLPHVNLLWTCVLSVVIGFILSSAFSAILVYAQELMPTRVGVLSGLFFGLAFGIAGIAAAVMGNVADTHGIEYVYGLCAYLPLLGVVTAFLPNVRLNGKKQKE